MSNKGGMSRALKAVKQQRRASGATKKSQASVGPVNTTGPKRRKK